MHLKTITARTALAISLILIVLNTASYTTTPRITGLANLANNNDECSLVFKDINRTAEYRLGGKSISGNMVETWYYLKGCRGEEVYVRVTRLKGVTPKNALILIHDYGETHLSLTGLALELVNEKALIVTVDLPNYDLAGRVKVLNSNPRDSWVYTAVCNIMRVVSLIKREYKVENVGLLGIAFGGVSAIIAAYYDDRVSYAISLGGLGGFRSSIGKASMLNYYIEDPKDANKCLDPLPLLYNIDKDVLIVLGSNDEIFPLDLNVVEEVVRNKHVSLSVIPNSGHFRIPSQWSNVVQKYVEYGFRDNNSFSQLDVRVENNGFEVFIESNNYSNILVMHRPSIPGYPWGLSVQEKEKSRYTYLIVPGQYLVLNSYDHVLHGVYYTRESYGFILGVVLLALWIFLDNETFRKIRRLNSIELVYGFFLVALLLYPIYPSILGIGRFHVSLLQVAETYLFYLPIITYLITFSLYIQPMIFAYMVFTGSRRAYMAYLMIPLFTTITSTTLIMFLGMRFYYTQIVLPTTTLALVAVIMLMDYLFSEKHPS